MRWEKWLGYSLIGPFILFGFLFSCQSRQYKLRATEVHSSVFQSLIDSSESAGPIIVYNRSRLKEKVRLYRKFFRKEDSLFPRKERIRLMVKNLIRGNVRLNQENDSISKQINYWVYKNGDKRINLHNRIPINEGDYGYYFSKPTFDKKREIAWVGIYSFNLCSGGEFYYYLLACVQLVEGKWRVRKIGYITRTVFG